ncbi:MAG: prohead protease, partial [Candidatus Dadabacteria bacterium]
MKSISGDLLQLFQSVERCASSQGISPWLVGGAVRDILLGNQPTDYDFAVEGNAIDLASSVAKEIGGEIRSHKRFYTATLLLKTPL